MSHSKKRNLVIFEKKLYTLNDGICSLLLYHILHFELDIIVISAGCTVRCQYKYIVPILRILVGYCIC